MHQVKYTEFQDNYGEAIDRLLLDMSLHHEMILDLVTQFFSELKLNASAENFCHHLSVSAFEEMCEVHSVYILEIFSVGMTMQNHQQKATELGHRYCFMGIPIENLARFSMLYHHIVQVLISAQKEKETLSMVLMRRLQFDLTTQFEVYSRVQKERLDAYNQIVRLSHNNLDTLAFLNDTLASLHQLFDKEATGFAFGMVKNGQFQHSLTKGNVAFDFNEEAQQYPLVKLEAMEVAWFEENAYIVNNIGTQSDLSYAFSQACEASGIRSFGFFILHDLNNAPRAYLLVCSRYTGYFVNQSMRHYWAQLADMVGMDFDLIEQINTKRKHGLGDGVLYRQLLAKGDVIMHYQPIIDPRTGKTAKFEALARLVDGERLIPPGIFLSAFGTNQLRELFEVSVMKVVEDLKSHAVPTPMCSVNLPPEALLDRDWMRSIPRYLLEIGATPDKVSIEILESSLNESQEIHQLLVDLNGVGYQIILDDVGVGESSLQRIMQLPITGIKIDQSFVRSLEHSFDSLDLILSMRFIALQRGIDFVVEGVENAQIIDVFSSMHNNRPLLQGYGISKPLDRAQLMDWLEEDRSRVPLSPKPQTLYGWYSRHVERLFTMRNALCTIGDLVSVDSLADANKCPLHDMIEAVGGDEELVNAHHEWHANYARITSLVQSGTGLETFWQEMEQSKRKLRRIIEGKISQAKSL